MRTGIQPTRNNLFQNSLFVLQYIPLLNLRRNLNLTLIRLKVKLPQYDLLVRRQQIVLLCQSLSTSLVLTNHTSLSLLSPSQALIAAWMTPRLYQQVPRYFLTTNGLNIKSTLPRTQPNPNPTLKFYDNRHSRTYSAPSFVWSMNGQIYNRSEPTVVQRRLKHHDRRSRSASGWAYPERRPSKGLRICN